ncbi:MAG: Glu-tRNA(Gln) amidotransferase subunit GatD [Candidatus Pacearchaeota archaeon]
MNIKNIEIGTRVKLHTKQGDFECVVLEAPESGIILAKLDSGYNIGIKEEDILDLNVIKEKAEKTSKKIEFKKITPDKNLPNIALVSTGGTISSRLDYKTGGVKWLTNPDELLNFYPELLGIANIIKVEMPFMKASENMSSKEWKKLSDVVSRLLNNSNVQGVIVTHGTDFLHYSASALAFALKNLNKPVVLTYSQRSSDRASSDARLNLLCSARVAVSEIAEVMLVGHANLDDEFCYALPATKVRKMHSSRRDTFRPINAKPIAKVWADKIETLKSYNKRDNGKKVKLVNKFSDKVALVKFYPGQNPDILEYYFKHGYKGIVLETSGLGHLLTEGKNNWIPKLKKAIKAGMIICATAQTIYGSLNPLVYSAGRELEKTGIIYLKDMLSETAFVKLSLVLGNPVFKKDIKRAMLTNFAGEFNNCLYEDEFLN